MKLRYSFSRRTSYQFLYALASSCLKCLPRVAIPYPDDLNSLWNERQKRWIISFIQIRLDRDNCGLPTLRWQLSNESKRSVDTCIPLRREMIGNHYDRFHTSDSGQQRSTTDKPLLYLSAQRVEGRSEANFGIAWRSLPSLTQPSTIFLSFSMLCLILKLALMCSLAFLPISLASSGLANS